MSTRTKTTGTGKAIPKSTTSTNATSSSSSIPVPTKRVQASGIPRPVTGNVIQRPTRKNATAGGAPAAGTKRARPISSPQTALGGGGDEEEDGARARKVQRLSPRPAPQGGTRPNVNGTGPGLYASGRRLPTPLMNAQAQASQPQLSQPAARPSSSSSRTSRTPVPSHPPSDARAQSREPSVKTEDPDDDISPLSPSFPSTTPPPEPADEAMDSDEPFDPWISEYITPTFTGPPSPDLVYARSFTKLGQRKPTPRRLLLPDEGDLSAMAKTVYYEAEDGEVEARSPSPDSRRREIRRRERMLDDVPLSPAKERGGGRILDGIDAGGEVDEQEEHEEEMDEQHQPENGETSGYVHDPRGFQVLEEVTPDVSMENQDQDDEPSETDTSVDDSLPRTSRVRAPTYNQPPQLQHQHRLEARDSYVPLKAAARGAGDSTFDDDSFEPDDVSSPAPAKTTTAVFNGGVRPTRPRESQPSFVLTAPTPTPEKPAPVPRSIPSSSILSPLREHPDAPGPRELEGDEDDEEEEDDGENSSGSEDLDPDTITLNGKDPKVVAQAAAILRMTKKYIVDDQAGDRSRDRSSRRTPSGGSHSSRHRSRSRSHSRAPRSHHAYAAGDISMPDLVDEVEVELQQQLPDRRPSSPSKVRSRPGSSNSMRLSLPDKSYHGNGRTSPAGSAADSSGIGSDSESGPDPWTKDDWKNLERCFVAERKIVGERLQLASSRDVDPVHVDVDLVVERFKGFLVASKQIKLGPDWERPRLVSRVTQMAQMLSDKNKKYRSAGVPAIGHPAFRVNAHERTPSTFGDELDYDRSLTVSRQGTPALASGLGSLYPQLGVRRASDGSIASNATTVTQAGGAYAHAQAQAQTSAESAVGRPSVTSRLLGFLRGRSVSGTPPPPTSEDAFKKPYPRASSSLRSVSGSESHNSTPSPSQLPPSVNTPPEMTQVRRDGQQSLVEPLRRASNGPMKDPNVRLMRERESAERQRALLRHRESAAVISMDSSPAGRGISVPPLNHVEMDYNRSSYSPANLPRRVRSVSSSSSVRDLVRGFEDLSQEAVRRAESPLGRSGSLNRSTSRSFDSSTSSAGSGVRRSARWSGGGGGESESDHKPDILLSQSDESFDPDSSGERTGQLLFSQTSFDDGAQSSKPRPKATMREIVVPPPRPIPEGAAPHKKRMSFLSQWGV